MKRSLAFATAALAVSFASADITGKWIGTMNTGALTGVSSGSKPTVTKGGPTYTLNLIKGGKYQMATKNPNGKDTSTEGTWKLSGTELILMPSAESKKLSPQIQDRKLKVGAGEKTITLEIKVKLMSAPAKMEGGKVDAKKAKEIEAMMAKAKDATMVIVFKRG